MTARPAVSIGIPVYNGEPFLPQTLSCLRAQSFTDIEIVISDNGSQDATEKICRQAAAEDDRVVYARVEQNRGMGWNFNRALGLASAPLFMWNCADDLAGPNYVQRCVAALRDRPDAVLAFSGIELIDGDGKVSGNLPRVGDRCGSSAPGVRIKGFLDAEAWDAVFGVMRTDALRAVGGLPPMVGDDVVLGVDLLLRAPFVYIDEPLFQRRRHSGQSSEQFDPIAGAVQQDPRSNPWVTFPHWRMNAELYRRVLAAHLRPVTALTCARAVFAGWTYPKRRRLLGDIRRSALTFARRLRQTVR